MMQYANIVYAIQINSTQHAKGVAPIPGNNSNYILLLLHNTSRKSIIPIVSFISWIKFPTM